MMIAQILLHYLIISLINLNLDIGELKIISLIIMIYIIQILSNISIMILLVSLNVVLI